MNGQTLTRHLDTVAAMCRDADPTGWTDIERDDVLAGLNTVSYEVVGLAARIRAAKVNDTKPPHPVKPLNPKPADKPPDPKPQPDPPAEPGSGD